MSIQQNRNFLGRSRTLQEGRNSTSNVQSIVTSDSFLNRIIRRGLGSTSNQQIIQLEEEINLDSVDTGICPIR